MEINVGAVPGQEFSIAITQPQIVRFRQKNGTEFDHVTADILQTLKLIGSKVKVTSHVKYE